MTTTGSSSAGTLVVLIDDVRRFRDDRPCRVARTSRAGVALLLELQGSHISDLWLDHDLGGQDDIWPCLRVLEEASLEGRPFDLGLVHVHAARSGPAHRMGVTLRRSGYRVERNYDLRVFTW